MSALELHGLHKKFGTLAALDNVHLKVVAGSRTAIVGPSGSGKTTLLRMIAGFEFPDAGSISLDGEILVDAHRQVPAHRRLIGYVPQDGALFPHLTIADNIGFGLPGNTRAKQPRVLELMDMVSLDTRMANRWPHELSGGQQQRVALARALAQRPRLMLLDEPFSALDTGLRATMRKTVAKLLAEAGVTTILVTHDQAEALSFADQLAVMRQGKLVQAGRPMDLYQRPRDEQTALFLGDAVILPATINRGWAQCDLGAVKVDDNAPHGVARIMLRPEQLLVSPAVQGDGLVMDSDFGGNNCTLTVEVAGRAISVRSAAYNAPALGSRVQISVVGVGHVVSAAQ